MSALSVHDLEGQLELARNVEASLRRELAELKANEARWCARIKELEGRLAEVARIASSHRVAALELPPPPFGESVEVTR